MRKNYLHNWKSCCLLLTAIALLTASAALSSGKANALLFSDGAAETTAAPVRETERKSVPETTYAYEQTVETLPYETIRLASPDLPVGEERVAQTGSQGIRICDYEVAYFDGAEIDRLLLTEEIEPAVNEIIEYGTGVDTVDADDRIAEVQKNEDGSGILTFASGSTMKFTAIKDVTATAYTAGRGGAGYITASGTPARPGAVAVDRRVIPLGSKLYIVTNDGKYVYGIAVAEDTGVIGDRVDLYYDDYDQCILFGRRAATIYILED